MTLLLPNIGWPPTLPHPNPFLYHYSHSKGRPTIANLHHPPQSPQTNSGSPHIYPNPIYNGPGYPGLGFPPLAKRQFLKYLAQKWLTDGTINHPNYSFAAGAGTYTDFKGEPSTFNPFEVFIWQNNPLFYLLLPRTIDPTITPQFAITALGPIAGSPYFKTISTFTKPDHTTLQRFPQSPPPTITAASVAPNWNLSISLTWLAPFNTFNVLLYLTNPRPRAPTTPQPFLIAYTTITNYDAWNAYWAPSAPTPFTLQNYGNPLPYPVTPFLYPYNYLRSLPQARAIQIGVRLSDSQGQWATPIAWSPTTSIA